MSYLFSFISLILISQISNVLSQNSSSAAGLGCSACTYYGSIDKQCELKVVPACNLPTECTSFLMDGLIVGDDSSIKTLSNEDDKPYLKDLMSTCKPVYYFFSHSEDDWNTILGNDVAQKSSDDTQSLSTYLDKNCEGLSGLILKDIDLYGDGNNSCVTNSLQVYLETLKTTFPNMEIGLNIVGTKLIDSCSDASKCADFSILDESLDFYILNVINFNPCTEEFQCSPSPVSGDAVYTLDQLPPLLEDLQIPKDKVHILFRGSPIFDGWNLCTTTYQQSCLAPTTNFTYCTDTQQSFVEKGQFAQCNTAGFIIENIDLMDPNCACECDRPFPGFYFLLDGYNNEASTTSCALFDSNCKNNGTN